MSWSKMVDHKHNGGLIFRDLVSFNKTLLAKQPWCILTQPRSLVATILREKYCHTEKLMSTKVKVHHSLLWKSLTTARDLIEQAMRWRVRNGEKSIFGDINGFPLNPLSKFSSLQRI